MYPLYSFHVMTSFVDMEYRAAVLCVSGLVMIAQGDTAAGKLRVSRVLKMGHTNLCNQQLVVQVVPVRVSQWFLV